MKRISDWRLDIVARRLAKRAGIAVLGCALLTTSPLLAQENDGQAASPKATESKSQPDTASNDTASNDAKLNDAKLNDTASDDASQHVILVVGAPGADEFGEPFQRWANQWREAAEKGGAGLTVIGLEKSEKTDRELLEAALKLSQTETPEPLWLVLIGHGTFDGRAAKFNLRGRDVAANEIVQWLSQAQRPLAIINSASSSGPFINRLSGPDRVIVTATKSGHEMNFARFGGEMSAAILGGAADLDKDGQTSLLEAFLTASSRVAEFYAQEGRLATEHALLDDNSDKLGTPATFFQGARAVKTAKKGAAVDGRRALQIVLNRSEQERALTKEQRAQRDQLEQKIAQLRDHKDELNEEVYYSELELLLLELSDVLLVSQEAAEQATPSER